MAGEAARSRWASSSAHSGATPIGVVEQAGQPRQSIAGTAPALLGVRCRRTRPASSGERAGSANAATAIARRARRGVPNVAKSPARARSTSSARRGPRGLAGRRARTRWPGRPGRSGCWSPRRRRRTARDRSSAWRAICADRSSRTSTGVGLPGQCDSVSTVTAGRAVDDDVGQVAELVVGHEAQRQHRAHSSDRRGYSTSHRRLRKWRPGRAPATFRLRGLTHWRQSLEVPDGRHGARAGGAGLSRVGRRAGRRPCPPAAGREDQERGVRSARLLHQLRSRRPAVGTLGP